VVDIDRGTDGRTWAYGISWCGDRAFIAWRTPDEILEYDVDFKHTGRRCDARDQKLGDLHQIICYDNKIWATNTGHNSISIFDCDTLELIETWRPHEHIPHDDDTKYFHEKKDKRTKPGVNYKHYNSIMFKYDRMYVNAHMTIKNPPSKVWEFTYPKRKFIRKILGGITSHNIFFLNGALTVCDSGNSCILQPEDNKVIFHKDVGSYLRGVSMPPNLFVVGRSDKRARTDRSKSKGGITVFKGRNFNNPNPDVRWLGRGPVEEIRCLDNSDDAHPTNVFWSK
jgi:hypothetical protein